MKNLMLTGFLILALVQWILPGQMIWQREKILKTGKVFKFETEPVDPVHPFKGKYIALNFKENQWLEPSSKTYEYGQDIYVLIKSNDSGFAKIIGISSREPSKDSDYIKATISYTTTDSARTTVHISFPFEEFYMDEYKAPKAEAIYNESAIDSTQKTYALIKVKNGNAVIEDVFINDTPIRNLIK